MKVKSLVVYLAGGLALLGAQATFACSTAAWSGGEVGSPTEGEPSAVKRYSQRCGLGATANGNYVVDNSPADEARVTGRLYFYSGAATGSGNIYELRDDAVGTPLLALSYDADNDQLDIATSSGSGSMNGMVQDRWWVIRWDWNTATNNVTVNARGAGSNTGLTQAVVTGVGSGDRADTSRVGHITGTFTGGQGRFWDAAEFRRTTVPNELCRGDANGSGTITAGDRSTITAELAGTLAPGQPDCDEAGTVTAGDRSCVTGLLAAGAVCP